MRKLPASSRPPKLGQGKRGEEGHIGYLLKQAAAASRLRVERALSDLEVTPPQFSVLTMVSAYPGVSNAELARLSLLTPQTVNVIVSNLERAGAIMRRPHAVHGRILHVDITETGRDLLARCKKRVEAIELRLIEGLSPDDETTIRRWLVDVAVKTAERP